MKLFKSLLQTIFPGKEIKAPAAASPEPALDNPEPVIEGAPPQAEVEPPTPVEPVDVEALMTEKAANHPEDLDWKRSIVDLMKLCDMDSSYENRKALALELGYPQADIESKGSAEMNMWLHKQVIQGIAENGGKVPADMLD